MAPDDPILLADVVDLILERKLERWSRQQLGTSHSAPQPLSLVLACPLLYCSVTERPELLWQSATRRNKATSIHHSLTRSLAHSIPRAEPQSAICQPAIQHASSIGRLSLAPSTRSAAILPDEPGPVFRPNHATPHQPRSRRHPRPDTTVRCDVRSATEAPPISTFVSPASLIAR